MSRLASMANAGLLSLTQQASSTTRLRTILAAALLSGKVLEPFHHHFIVVTQGFLVGRDNVEKKL